MTRGPISLPVTPEGPLHENSAPSAHRHPDFRNVVSLAVHDRKLSLLRRAMLGIKKPPASPSGKAISLPSRSWLSCQATCHGIDFSPSVGFRVCPTRSCCECAVESHASIPNVPMTKHAQGATLERAIIPEPPPQVQPEIKGESGLFEKRSEVAGVEYGPIHPITAA